MNFLILHIASFVFAFIFTFYLIKIVTKIAYKYSIMDFPDGKIKKHDGGVPYLGGIAIFVSFICTLGLFYPFKNSILWLVIGCILILFVGFFDDLINFSPLQKLIGQVVAVICFLRGGLSLKEAFFSDFWSLAISGFWMLLIINAFNLVDVMDGLSTSLAIIAATSFFVIAILMKQYLLSLLLITFIAPLLVFFIYNKPSAKIYMGDCGSLFLGGFLAAVPLLFCWSSKNEFGFFVPILILIVPLSEVTMLILIRTFLGIPFYRGSPHHIASFLLAKKLSKYKILLMTSVFAIYYSIFAILFLFNFVSIVSLFYALIAFWFLWVSYVYLQKK
ncbi:TPA: hypothetical protein DEO28_02380 [Candidatus Dependentiae bacterium]|nr:MAG: hypothetical protein UR14_C0008G0034 [candidate division TM6 bacterium GW2011_GWE2_31_21]KKP53240.1 MAG: hypothetical protein UR43_C0006G0023 [candidate division TM6 bacterium GW2011_GWF2_33_332]HBS48061.1 hypothetical protein [Candidatus Dependentiae bacterium]HBZ73336.1 hypothetical protein [Candidatus Dependentiae bacterium]